MAQNDTKIQPELPFGTELPPNQFVEGLSVGGEKGDERDEEGGEPQLETFLPLEGEDPSPGVEPALGDAGNDEEDPHRDVQPQDDLTLQDVISEIQKLQAENLSKMEDRFLSLEEDLDEVRELVEDLGSEGLKAVL